jgi:exonuclease III
VVVEDFNTPLSLIDMSSRQKNQQRNLKTKWHHRSNGPADVYRIFHSTTAKYTFFSAVHGTSSTLDHNLGHKESLNKHKKTEIIPCILSDHYATKAEFNNKNCRRK